MGKVIKFENENDKRIEGFVKNMQDAIKEYKLDNMLFISKTPDGEVIIGKSNMNIIIELELIGHLQIDTMNMVIKENYVTP